MLKLSKCFMLMVFTVIILILPSCTEDEEEERITIKFSFDEDLEGWNIGTSGKSLDGVLWIDYCGQPPGAVKLDGSDSGNPDKQPNSWIYKEIKLPEKVTTLNFITSAHNREGANAELRVRLIDESQTSNILIDWELANPGVEGECIWIEKDVEIYQFAGQTITLFFEQGDNDIGMHEQRYIDNILIE